jgi:hypothetical protein
MIIEEHLNKAVESLLETPFKLALHTKYKERLKNHLTEHKKNIIIETTRSGLWI